MASDWLGVDTYWSSKEEIDSLQNGKFVKKLDKHWQQFTPENSGYPGSEPLAMILVHDGRLLVGIRTGGLVIYQNL